VPECVNVVWAIRAILNLETATNRMKMALPSGPRLIMTMCKRASNSLVRFTSGTQQSIDITDLVLAQVGRRFIVSSKFCSTSRHTSLTYLELISIKDTNDHLSVRDAGRSLRTNHKEMLI
jgi:hypothetical protein